MLFRSIIVKELKHGISFLADYLSKAQVLNNDLARKYRQEQILCCLWYFRAAVHVPYAASKEFTGMMSCCSMESMPCSMGMWEETALLPELA